MNATHVFQNNLGKLLVVEDNRFYLKKLPNSDIQLRISIKLELSRKIIGVCKIIASNIYIFYDSIFIEYNEQSTQISNSGHSKDMFPGVTEEITSDFPYKSGNIFFERNGLLQT